MIAKESDIIMGSREEFDLTEKLIQPNMSDNESAAFGTVVVLRLS